MQFIQQKINQNSYKKNSIDTGHLKMQQKSEIIDLSTQSFKAAGFLERFCVC